MDDFDFPSRPSSTVEKVAVLLFLGLCLLAIAVA